MNKHLRRQVRDPQVRALVDAAMKAGWEVGLSRSSHIHMRNPKDGCLIVLAGSGSDHRAHKNAASIMRKQGIDV